jgi:hypothetical protein
MSSAYFFLLRVIQTNYAFAEVFKDIYETLVRLNLHETEKEWLVTICSSVTNSTEERKEIEAYFKHDNIFKYFN